MRPCGTFDESYSQDMAICRTRFQWVMLILGLVLLFAVVPFFGYSWLNFINLAAIFIVATLGLQIIMGYCGLVSIGHMAFIAVGAVVTASLTHHLGWSWIAALPVAVIVTALVGLVFGLPTFRIKGFYIALSTMAAHFIIIWVIVHGGEVTGGDSGLSVPPPAFGNIVIDSEGSFFYFNMIFLVLMTFLAKNLVRMKLGRAFIAIRDNDIAAEFMGINIFRYKLIAFVIGSAFAGVAGALLAPYYGFILADSFPFVESIWFIGYIIIGGVGSITGVYFGVIFFMVLKQLVLLGGPMVVVAFPAIGMGVVASLLKMLFGLVIILFLIFEPRGLYHRWEVVKSSIRLWPFPY